MRAVPLSLGLCLLAANVVPASADEATVLASLVGDWGDATGRLACADDGEYLQFQEDGQVTLVEGGGSSAVAQLADSGDGTLSMTFLEDGGDVALILTPQDDGSLAITGATVGGVPHAEAFEDLHARHGAWVPCP